MNFAAEGTTAVRRPAISPWVVAAAVVIPTFMEVLDTTIANVALRYIAGGLSASEVDSEWVLTSYLAANATILPTSGWLAAHLGRRNYFLISIGVFTLASGLCSLATSLEQIVVFRVLHGAVYTMGLKHSLRSLVWFGGFACVVALLVLAALRVGGAATPMAA